MIKAKTLNKFFYKIKGTYKNYIMAIFIAKQKNKHQRHSREGGNPLPKNWQYLCM
jgi:hypothetical protein